jgi:hypothetical protein
VGPGGPSANEDRLVVPDTLGTTIKLSFLQGPARLAPADYVLRVTSWSFLTNHARVLLCIARDPGMRLRDLAASLGITERSAHGIVTDLATAGYVVKQKDGRRNRYQIQAHLPLPEPTSREPAIGQVLALLAGTTATRKATRSPEPGT